MAEPKKNPRKKGETRNNGKLLLPPLGTLETRGGRREGEKHAVGSGRHLRTKKENSVKEPSGKG